MTSKTFGQLDLLLSS